MQPKKHETMILSMTGYGKAETHINGHKFVAEIKGLNSKQLDLTTRLAPELREHELRIRQTLAVRLERGKAELKAETENTGTEGCTSTINRAAFMQHWSEIESLRAEKGLPPTDLTEQVLRLKDVIQESPANVWQEEDLQAAEDAISRATDAFIAFRKQEGAALEKMFREKLDAIEKLLGEVEQYEKGRIEKIRQHLLQNLGKLAEETRNAVDHNRLEQEMIFWLEKLDITEEKVRLANHIRYFRETMDGDGSGVGKKLGFIAQEMGREINTLGSKSNQSEMQIIVVKMKDLLEQIKEQVLNVL